MPADDAPPRNPLRQRTRPSFEAGAPELRVVDLFAGCGGLSLGIAQAIRAAGRALRVAMAADVDPDALAVYKSNFPKAMLCSRSVEDFFDGSLGTSASRTEQHWKEEVGLVHALVGGPPCQGHSNLNNHTRRDDPKNGLYLLMARAAQVLQPAAVLIENVPAIEHDKQQVVTTTRRHLETLGYNVAVGLLRLDHLGVAQRRRRHILLATRQGWRHPQVLLKEIADRVAETRDLRWAIGDLAEISFRAGVDAIPSSSSANRARMTWLLENDEYDLPNRLRPKCHQNDHSYKSMYGRLQWNEPAQTITSGFSSIGQGRYMHPDQCRALTAHEAARIQGFPDYFDFSAARKKTALGTMIGNAVPPALGREVFRALIDNSSLT